MRRGFVFLCLALLSFKTTAALADPAIDGIGSSAMSGRLDLVYALSSRAGQLETGGVGVRFGGFAPSHLRLSGLWYPTTSRFGLYTDLAFESFRVSGADVFGQARSLRLNGFRFALGGSARFLLNGGLSVEALAGYAFERIPAAEVLSFEIKDSSLRLHGPVIGGALNLEPGGRFSYHLRARAMPFSFGASAASSAVGGGAAHPLALGAQVAIQLKQWARYWLNAVVDYELNATWAEGSQFTASQSAHRFGVGLQWKRSPASPSVSAGKRSQGAILRGRVLLPDGTTAAAGAEVHIGTLPPIAADDGGRFAGLDVPSGPVKVVVTVPSHRIFERTLTLVPGQDVELNITLEKRTGPGTIHGVILSAPASDKDGALPLPLMDALVETARGVSVRTAADGTFVLKGVGPGPVPVKLRLKGFKPVEEVIAVPPEGAATLNVTLERTGTRALAMLRGQVRTNSGVAVTAQLSIPEARLKTATGRDGRFLIRLRGGRYTVTFQAEGFHTQTKTVEVADGDQAYFYVDLTAKE